MFEYQKNNRYFASVTGQTEEICEEELIELGATNTEKAYRGVYFEADQESLYRINYNSRLITRVLAPLLQFSCWDGEKIKENASKINWDKFLSLEKTFAITASVSKSNINHSLYASQCLKDGIVDWFREKYGKRPNVETEKPDVRLNLHIEKNQALISLDCSGDSLHKRGYRLLAGEAPMQETVAAAIIRNTGWNGEKPLMDCMCGSGTIIAEALMHYCRIPAQYLRSKFGFFNLPDFDKTKWENLKAECDSQIRELPEGLITGSDISKKVLEVAHKNLERLPFSQNIKLLCKPFQKIDSFENGVLIVNPPYGIRLSNSFEVQILYKELGDFIKQNCNGSTAFVYTGNINLRKHIGLRTSKRIPLVNGKLEGVLMQFDSYEGSKKARYRKDEESETEN